MARQAKRAKGENGDFHSCFPFRSIDSPQMYQGATSPATAVMKLAVTISDRRMVSSSAGVMKVIP